MPQPFDTKWLFDFPKRKKEKSNVRISNYMPIILWIIQKCHANISQICNIHNDVFFKVLLQKVEEGEVLSRVVSFYDVWIFLAWLSTFSHAHPDAIDCFFRTLFAWTLIKLPPFSRHPNTHISFHLYDGCDSFVYLSRYFI